MTPKPKPRSKLCVDGKHGWCANRTLVEANCSCRCHRKPKPRKDTRLAGLEAAEEAVKRVTSAPWGIPTAYEALASIRRLIRAERRRRKR